MGTAEERTQRVPAATGDLTTTPFAHLLLYLYRKSLSGTLVVHGSSPSPAQVLFRAGRAVAARLSECASSLGEGLIPLCGLTAGSYAFYEEDLLQQGEAAKDAEIDPYPLIAAASLDGYVRDDVVDLVLERMADARLRIQKGREIARLALQSTDAMVIELLRAGPATVAELLDQAPVEQLRARRLLYVLIVSHMIAPYDDRGRSEAHQTQPRPVEESSERPLSSLRPAGGMGPERATFRSVNEVAAQGGVPAWQALASLRPTSGPVGPVTAKVSIPPVRMPSAAPSAPQEDVDDREAALRSVERLCERGEYDAAVDIAAKLVAMADRYDQAAANAHAAYAYALFKKHCQNKDGLPRDVVNGVRRALEIDADHPRALLTKGLVFKQADDMKKALHYFKRASTVDRHNIEAQREYRLAQMRTRS